MLIGLGDAISLVLNHAFEFIAVEGIGGLTVCLNAKGA